MKTSQIVHQLKAVLPKYCDDFSDSINITNIAVNGTNIIYTTDGNHHIEDGNTFLVCDVKNYYEIISLKKYGSIAIALANQHHNISKTYQTVEITGASDAKYNGIKNISKDTLFFNVQSKIINSNDTATITTVEDNPFIVNANYTINVNGSLLPIKSIVNSKTFIIDNFIGLANDSILTQVSLSPSTHIFFYSIDSTAVSSPTGSIKLLEKRNFGYNGYKIVSSHTHNTITCTVNDATGLPYLQNSPIGTIKSRIRIVGTTDYDRAKEIFLNGVDATSQTKSWLFVYTLPRTTGKDPNGKTDVNVENLLGTGISARLIQGIELCVMINLGEVASSIGLADEKDKVSEYLKPICQAIAGFIPESPFSNNVIYQKLTPVVDQIKESEKSFYSHSFIFETFIEFTKDQEIKEYDTFALANLSFDLKDANNNNLISNIGVSF